MNDLLEQSFVTGHQRIKTVCVADTVIEQVCYGAELLLAADRKVSTFGRSVDAVVNVRVRDGKLRLLKPHTTKYTCEHPSAAGFQVQIKCVHSCCKWNVRTSRSGHIGKSVLNRSAVQLATHASHARMQFSHYGPNTASALSHQHDGGSFFRSKLLVVCTHSSTLLDRYCT